MSAALKDAESELSGACASVIKSLAERSFAAVAAPLMGHVACMGGAVPDDMFPRAPFEGLPAYIVAPFYAKGLMVGEFVVCAVTLDCGGELYEPYLSSYTIGHEPLPRSDRYNI